MLKNSDQNVSPMKVLKANIFSLLQRETADNFHDDTNLPKRYDLYFEAQNLLNDLDAPDS